MKSLGTLKSEEGWKEVLQGVNAVFAAGLSFFFLPASLLLPPFQPLQYKAVRLQAVIY